jgi:hypothetical protein
MSASAPSSAKAARLAAPFLCDTAASGELVARHGTPSLIGQSSARSAVSLLDQSVSWYLVKAKVTGTSNVVNTH